MIRWATDHPGKEVPRDFDIASPPRPNSKRPPEPLPDYGRPSTPRRDYRTTEDQSLISDSLRRRAEMGRWREIEEAAPGHRQPPLSRVSARPPLRQEPYSWTEYLEDARLQEYPKQASLDNVANGERQNGGYHGNPERGRVSAAPPVSMRHGRPVSRVGDDSYHKDFVGSGHIFKGNHNIPGKNIDFPRHNVYNESPRPDSFDGWNGSYVKNGIVASSVGDGRSPSYKRDGRPASYRIEGRPASSVSNVNSASYPGGGGRPASYRGDDRFAFNNNRRPASNIREDQVPSYIEENKFAPHERNGEFAPYTDEGRIDSYVFRRNDRPFQDNVRGRQNPRGPEGRSASYMW